ncbi:hypothetical protein KSP40_PGU000490 [Platanthera guangdongensis]|uniref:Uncharacterized protein n=1 Tax=Platanthera guangdongensis TaxID=2320717 RepID=A0ABR2M8S7_9ASPA
MQLHNPRAPLFSLLTLPQNALANIPSPSSTLVLVPRTFCSALISGRYDIARALEKWGGLQGVSRLPSLQGRHPRRKLDPTYREIQQDSNVSDDPQDQETTSHKPHVSLDAQKWLTNLKNLNINCVK